MRAISLSSQPASPEVHMKTRLLALAVLALVMGCEGAPNATAPSTPPAPWKTISAGAHGDKKDFFSLPPMVPLPIGNPDFELGKFNNALKASLKIEICQLKSE